MANATSILEDRLIGDRELHKLLGWHEGTAAIKRGRGTLPFPYVRIGRQIRYRLSVVEQFIDANTVAPKPVNA